MPTLLSCVIVYLLYLIIERIALTRAQRRIPIRIAVTGTRGKSTVARLLASILREDGRRVVAKTTGSEAVVLLPDGSQVEVERRGTPSILEQKQLIHRAARLKADCLIAEVMSIRPENHYIESRHLLRPNYVAVTNVRKDHIEAMGATEGRIASVLSLDICARSTVFLPVAEDCAAFRAESQCSNADLLRVPAGASAELLALAPDLARTEFADNLDLVYAVATHLGVAKQTVITGIQKAQHDIGRLRIWRYYRADPEHSCYLVNAFAANDPESTFKVLTKAKHLLPGASGDVIGIINLRADRLPRTAQWIDVLKQGELRRFKLLFVVGAHARLFKHRLPEARVLTARAPEEIMSTICAQAGEHSMIFGFGNVKGTGRLLAEHWNKIGATLA